MYKTRKSLESFANICGMALISRLGLQSVTLFAGYHRWANARIASKISELTQEQRQRDTKLPFMHIDATLNHMLCAEYLWYGRMLGVSEVNTVSLQSLSNYWTGDTRDVKWSQPPSPLSAHDLLANVLRQSDAWVQFVADLSEDRLGKSFEYIDTRGDKHTRILLPALLHVFNHATHHRGQLTAAIHAVSGMVPELDLSYYIQETTPS